MRAFCTVSAPLEVCAPPTHHRPLPPGARFLALRLLGTPQPRTLYFLVEAKSRVREVYAQTCHHFSKQGMLDTELFGLAVLIDGEYLFTDPESKLSKYGPKSWRSSHTHGLDANGKPLLELHFRVQFYVESPSLLRDEISRHNYYLQLKSNSVSRDLKDCPDQSLLMLGGLSLQADLGDCPSTSIEDTDTNIKFEEYLPPHLRVAWAINALQSCYRENRGMSRADAETHFIREACALNESINAHVFRMRNTKSETGIGSVQLCIYAKGMKVFIENQPVTTFLWPNIVKLSFDRKKFEIRSGENKIVLYSANDEKNKMLLALCRETHQFSMKIAPRLTEAIKREEEESNCMHACYLYSRALNLPYKSKSDQRISVISSTSSNTTSGIVSDRVHSEDELEILINGGQHPPIAAPSTESLALAHLLDCPSVSRQTSSVGQVSLKELEDTFAGLSASTLPKNIKSRSNSSEEADPVNKEQGKDLNDSDSLPNSSHNIGSQCSSTCSTIVVATDTVSLPPMNRARSPTDQNRRQNSTCSSLELGFSHTAQNSSVSEVMSTDNFIDSSHYRSQSTNVNDVDAENEDDEDRDMYTAVPAPTETSGVYTMNSSEITGQSSEVADSESHEASSHYGSFIPTKSEVDACNLDSVDGDFRPRMDSDAHEFRLRSDSNVSGSGSFRGDGSDPSDTKHTLLSAEELSDLIVGRGTYPSRKTVSDTMDSDCDYVTLPLSLEGESYLQGSEDTAPIEDEYDQDLLVIPPTPPKRVDSNPNRSLSSIVDVHSTSPPPYHAEHVTTGLRGPDVQDIPPVREQPQYYNRPSILPTPSEEANARFITTKPHINILKAHTSMVNESPKPSYAAPTATTLNSSIASSLTAATTIGIPIVPYNINQGHKSMSLIPQPPRYLEQKPAPPRTCVLLPVMKPRRRQPPPPPPGQLATVYTSQLARSQIELYQQQLYSDVDYVIYPLQDPAISQQEYLDAKQGSILAAMAQSPQPPQYLAYHTVRAHNRSWDACKNHAIYRSTPYLSMALSSSSRYASTQNLSDTYVQLPSAYSPLYSPSMASLCSSYDVPPPPPLRPRPMPSSQSLYARSRSDENLLNPVDPTQSSISAIGRSRRLPPPPPPSYNKIPLNKPIRKPALPTPCENDTPPAVPAKPARLKEQLASSATLCNTKPAIRTQITNSTQTTQTIAQLRPNVNINGTAQRPTSIDINTLREKSKHLDLPLISALCNDQSLLKQTRAFVMPKHPKMGISQVALTPKGKYPVSGLSTTQLQKQRNKSSISHRHPNDKLPPLPPVMQLAEGNNYVMDPTPAAKHKSFNNSSIQKPMT